MQSNADPSVPFTSAARRLLDAERQSLAKSNIATPRSIPNSSGGRLWGKGGGFLFPGQMAETPSARLTPMSLALEYVPSVCERSPCLPR